MTDKRKWQCESCGEEFYCDSVWVSGDVDWVECPYCEETVENEITDEFRCEVG